MKLLIKSAVIVSKEHSLNGKKTDILIENGVITSISNNIESKDAEVFTVDNLHVSIGWMDMRANFCDPGYEHREDLKTGLKAAAKGGF
ncbi:MAG: dihydroorotase, partial [Bacteroidia bacterium]